MEVPKFTPEEIKMFLGELEIERQVAQEMADLIVEDTPFKQYSQDKAKHLGGLLERARTIYPVMSEADIQQYHETMAGVEIK